jgi:WXG100 family type VII secretion target
MTRFKVDTDELERVSARLAAKAALCDTLLTEVEALAATASAQWSGEANDQFLALKAEWAAGARQMAEGIQTIHAATTASTANYHAITDAAKRIW